MAARTIAGLVDAVAIRSPSKLALLSPFQSSQKFTYEELSTSTNALAGWLSLYGYERGDLLVSDLPNVSENLMLQIACNRLGVVYATAKNIEAMAKDGLVFNRAFSNAPVCSVAPVTGLVNQPVDAVGLRKNPLPFAG